MKRILSFITAFLLLTTMFSFLNVKAGQTDSSKSDESTVTGIVKSFGSALQQISLQAPKDILKKDMPKIYGKYVTQELITKWLNNPLQAPGRLVSSPWPDRIDIQTVKRISDSEYEVKGEIVEITSVEKVSGGAAAKRPITLWLKKADGKWLISDVLLGAYERSNRLEYINTKYGFSFSLPVSWKNYKIINAKWEGNPIGGSQVVESGPEILIRHPLWTKEKPRQDIPIMIFTIAQWNKLQKEQFHIGAAPIGPSELGRNNKYMFALPARYNFAFPEGFEEVQTILNGKPLHPKNI